jgi:hypothetical protein
MSVPILMWIIVAALFLAGLAGLLIPGLPGIPLLYVGMLVAAWIDHFQRIGPFWLIVLGGLTLFAVAVDYAAAAMGAKRVGASALAIFGAFVGTIVGLLGGIVGLLIGPFVGAAIGEFIMHGDIDKAGRVGFGTWLGMLIGAVVKIGVAFAMLGVFVFAYFVG